MEELASGWGKCVELEQVPWAHMAVEQQRRLGSVMLLLVVFPAAAPSCCLPRL